MPVIAARTDARALHALHIQGQKRVERFGSGFLGALHLDGIGHARLQIDGQRRPDIALAQRTVLAGDINGYRAGRLHALVPEGFGHQRVAQVRRKALRGIVHRKARGRQHRRLQRNGHQLPVDRRGRRRGHKRHDAVRQRAGREQTDAQRQQTQPLPQGRAINSLGISHQSPSSSDENPTLSHVIIYHPCQEKQAEDPGIWEIIGKSRKKHRSRR